MKKKTWIPDQIRDDGTRIDSQARDVLAELQCTLSSRLLIKAHLLRCFEKFRPSRISKYASVLNFSCASLQHLSEQPAFNDFFNILKVPRSSSLASQTSSFPAYVPRPFLPPSRLHAFSPQRFHAYRFSLLPSCPSAPPGQVFFSHPSEKLTEPGVGQQSQPGKTDSGPGRLTGLFVRIFTML